MQKHSKVAQLVEEAYTHSNEPFAHWMLQNHLPIVAKETERLTKKFHANPEISVAGALLHDFGDAFVHRHAKNHEETSRTKAIEILKKCDYSEQEIHDVLINVIAPHSCKEGNFPKTLEGQVMATADALAHLNTDFYLQFAWMHLPENKTYPEFIDWADEKLDRDFNSKIFFNEVKDEVRGRYEALMEIFAKK